MGIHLSQPLSERTRELLNAPRTRFRCCSKVEQRRACLIYKQQTRALSATKETRTTSLSLASFFLSSSYTTYSGQAQLYKFSLSWHLLQKIIDFLENNQIKSFENIYF